jgi:hypothetical protein
MSTVRDPGMPVVINAGPLAGTVGIVTRTLGGLVMVDTGKAADFCLFPEELDVNYTHTVHFRDGIVSYRHFKDNDAAVAFAQGQNGETRRPEDVVKIVREADGTSEAGICWLDK